MGSDGSVTIGVLVSETPRLIFPTRPTFVTVLHAGEPAAVCTLNETVLAPEIAAMPLGHPDRVLVQKKADVSRAYLTGDVEGPYRDNEVETVSRRLLERESATVPTGPPLRPRHHR